MVFSTLILSPQSIQSVQTFNRSMELRALYDRSDDNAFADTTNQSDVNRLNGHNGVFEVKPTAAGIKPAWKSSTKIFEPYSVTYRSPQPADRFNFVLFVVLMQAIAMFLPTNMFINAENFFRDFKLDSPFKANNITNFTFNNNLHNSIESNLLVNKSSVWSFTRRITISIVIQALALSLTVILALINTSECKSAYILLTFLSVIVLNASNGVFQNCVHSMTAFLPPNYTRVLVFGLYLGGAFMSALQITCLSSIQSQRSAYIYYFVASVLLLLVCFDAYYASSLSRFYRYYKSKSKTNLSQEFDDRSDDQSSNDWSFVEILTKCWKHYLNIYLVCLVSYTIYPSIQSDIRPVTQSLADYIPNHLWTHFTSHLLFNISSAFGCLITRCANTVTTRGPSHSRLWVLIVTRVAFIPFYIFCNFSPETRGLPVIVNSDFVEYDVWLNKRLLSHISAMNATKAAKPDHSLATGMLAALSLMSGLLSASILSFVITRRPNTCYLIVFTTRTPIITETLHSIAVYHWLSRLGYWDQMTDNCRHYLSEVKTGSDVRYYLLSECLDTKYKLSLVSADGCLEADIDYEEYRRLNADNETTDDLNDKHKKLSEALRLGSKRVSADTEDYCYDFAINSGDNTIAISLHVFEDQELIAEQPLLTIACRQVLIADLLSLVMSKLVSIMVTKDQLIAELTKQNQSLRELSERSVKDLDEFVVKKEENDSLLFTKFVSILNQKKSKICELEEVLRNK
ncbi:unnamed protein product [Medioppia subpectinata]|uniref:Uncharacterized protein n=1 Tax=Medioppia subpectinata TaxID=1979941 RepID=A0A7R9KFB8_9ACAR|nr:unnamed protein product [Medioppia subpectinata]CAG2101301.1 unnamed protein product [Medioppia subpectinata]